MYKDSLIEIKLKSLVNNTDNNTEGVKLYCILDDYFKNNDMLLLVVDSDMSLTSSFLNSSFGNIIDKYGYDKLKNSLKIKTNKNQIDRIKDYLEKYNEVYC